MGTKKKLLIKSFSGDNEQVILFQFSEMLTKWTCNEPRYICAHNGREFDFPYLCRRFIINGMPIPAILNATGKKPWEVKYIADTLELWKFGDHKNYTSLDLLSHTLGIASPKDEMDGSMVGKYYWEQQALEDIKRYCEKDVVTVAQVYLRLLNLPLLSEEQVVITN